MNVVILCGRITREPETRESQGGMKICRYTLAIDRRIKKDGEQTADFVSCTAFAKAADFAGKYYHKGMRVLVRGRIQTGSYTNKDGNKVYTTDIIVDEQEFADGKQGAKEAPAEPAYTQESFMDIPDDADSEGLPFN